MTGGRIEGADIVDNLAVLGASPVDVFYADYAQAILAAGGRPVFVPLDARPADYVDLLDGFLLDFDGLKLVLLRVMDGVVRVGKASHDVLVLLRSDGWLALGMRWKENLVFWVVMVMSSSATAMVVVAVAAKTESNEVIFMVEWFVNW